MSTARQLMSERTRAVALRVVDRLEREKTPVHPMRSHVQERLTIGERAADILASAVGSWRFVIWQNVLVLLWIAFNAIALLGFHWDPYPFILLNLAFSWQASNTGPILQLSSNRQATIDRKRDDTEAREVEMLLDLLQQNTALTQQVADLTRLIHEHITADKQDAAA